MDPYKTKVTHSPWDWIFLFPFFFVSTNVHHDGSTSKANAVNMKAVVCNIPHLEPRGGELDTSGTHSN